MTAKRVIEKYGKENVTLLFTDTLIEDEDLYRFLDDTEKDLGIEITRVQEGRDPWELFKDVRYLGNSRIAQCSHILKQKASEKWLKAHYKPEECILYLGIDWTEEHRTKAPKKNWDPYQVEFPMCEEPLLTKEDMLNELKKAGIEIPRLYKMGFSHNNCGGFCVRAGQGHFANLLKQMPERYMYHEEKEQEMREFLDKDVSILTRTRNGVKENLTLKQLREELETAPEQIDMFDIGGCGCFVSDEN
jgi:3'-phosphoadenosine 5'-phosphosulfate sulfotransferase (PAPS reductase)/FAD synthetase